VEEPALQWTGHPYLLCEELTDAVRHALPAARNRGLSVIFDYLGLMPLAREESHALRSLVERLLSAWIAASRSSDIDCVAEVEASGPAHCRLQLRVGSSDARRIELEGERAGAAEPAAASLIAVRTLCQALGASFDYQCSQEHGAQATVTVQVPCLAPVDAKIETDAEGAEAWLLGSKLRGAHRRLQRLGWNVSVLPNVDAAEQQLARTEPPRLIVGSEWDGISLSDMAWLREVLKNRSPQPQLFLAVDGASEAARTAGVAGIYVQVLPFSPRQLLHVTHLARLARRASA
jgi:hypothetical protein